MSAKKILAIESSCDETACSIIDEDYKVYSSIVSSQIKVHEKFGGVIPEIASRMHVEQISIIVKEALKEANLTMDDIDYIGYTYGPGLIGSLHIGSIAAKTLAFFYDKPLVGVHHLKGHIFINELVDKIEYPLMSLVVSGGHTELVYMKDDNTFQIIGTTLDDAIGESYDKIARVVGLGYPGGPKVDKASKDGKPSYKLPTPKVDGYNFSFSGLKNAALQLVKKEGENININDFCESFQETALNSLIKKTKDALEEYDVKTILIAGGVSANSRLRELMQESFSNYHLILPPLKYCTDNATMIGCAAIHYIKHNKFVDYSYPSVSSHDLDD